MKVPSSTVMPGLDPGISLHRETGGSSPRVTD
jgi:hypothetical protein